MQYGNRSAGFRRAKSFAYRRDIFGSRYETLDEKAIVRAERRQRTSFRASGVNDQTTLRAAFPQQCHKAILDRFFLCCG
jgi:hypothetical protein